MRTAVFVLLYSLVAAPVFAARVAGVVVDGSGAPIGGALVAAGTATTTTADDGSFLLADAPDGSQIRITAPGFAPAFLVAADAEGVRVTLQPAPLVDTIVVTASRGAARLATPEATTVVTSAERPPARSTTPFAIRPASASSAARRHASRIRRRRASRCAAFPDPGPAGPWCSQTDYR